ncbi:MAG: hypothetical protein HY549_02485 [Elusimicrobia bacterium]|nr:hypothetical protein [Elusimicrobiota bacterium]
MDFGSQVGQLEESRELVGVDADFPGQGLLGQAGIGGKAGFEFAGLLEESLNARRLRLAGALRPR